jgi:hypothetical protein
VSLLERISTLSEARYPVKPGEAILVASYATGTVRPSDTALLGLLKNWEKKDDGPLVWWQHNPHEYVLKVRTQHAKWKAFWKQVQKAVTDAGASIKRHRAMERPLKEGSVEEARAASKSQISYAKHLLKQQGLKSPTAAEIDAMDELTISKLIDGLKKKRGEPMFYGNGKFKGWKKGGKLAEYSGIGGRVAGARHPFRLPLSNVSINKTMTPERREKIREREQRRQDVRERLRQIALGEGRRPLKTLR